MSTPQGGCAAIRSLFDTHPNYGCPKFAPHLSHPRERIGWRAGHLKNIVLGSHLGGSSQKQNDGPPFQA